MLNLISESNNCISPVATWDGSETRKLRLNRLSLAARQIEGAIQDFRDGVPESATKLKQLLTEYIEASVAFKSRDSELVVHVRACSLSDNVVVCEEEAPIMHIEDKFPSYFSFLPMHTIKPTELLRYQMVEYRGPSSASVFSVPLTALNKIAE